MRRRRLPGGTLCHGPLLALDGHVVYTGHRGRRPVTRALPLTLTGRARTLERRIVREAGGRVAIVDLDRGRRDVVPGGGMLGGRPAIARLFGHRYGAERAVPLPVDPGGEVLSIATAPAPG